MQKSSYEVDVIDDGSLGDDEKHTKMLHIARDNLWRNPRYGELERKLRASFYRHRSVQPPEFTRTPTVTGAFRARGNGDAHVMAVLDLYAGLHCASEHISKIGREITYIPVDWKPYITGDVDRTVVEDIPRMTTNDVRELLLQHSEYDSWSDYCKFTSLTVWASVDCTEYCMLNTTKTEEKMKVSDRQTAHVTKLSQDLRELGLKVLVVIENGKTSKLWERDVAKEAERVLDLKPVHVSYCQYGMVRRKDTTLLMSRSLAEVFGPRARRCLGRAGAENSRCDAMVPVWGSGTETWRHAESVQEARDSHERSKVPGKLSLSVFVAAWQAMDRQWAGEDRICRKRTCIEM